MNIYSKKSLQKALELDSDDINSEDAGFMLGYLEDL